jgi:hypothetical protein
LHPGNELFADPPKPTSRFGIASFAARAAAVYTGDEAAYPVAAGDAIELGC